MFHLCTVILVRLFRDTVRHRERRALALAVAFAQLFSCVQVVVRLALPTSARGYFNRYPSRRPFLVL